MLTVSVTFVPPAFPSTWPITQAGRRSTGNVAALLAVGLAKSVPKASTATNVALRDRFLLFDIVAPVWMSTRTWR